MDTKDKSLFQERLVSLFLRLNGYLQSGYITHSEKWGNAGTDIDRIALRFPNHSQIERGIECSPLLQIPQASIDIIIAEVKNNSLEFNDAIAKTGEKTENNWKQILNWIGLFSTQDVHALIPKLIELTNKNGEKTNDSFGKVEYNNNFGLITIRPILFAFEKEKSNNNTKIWINGPEILSYIWECFCPEIKRDECSTRYPFKLWGNEYSDIVEYVKERAKKEHGIGSIDEMYSFLIK